MSKLAPLRPEEFTLLIVDDLSDNRELLCRRFRKQGFSVREAASGAEALALIEQGGLDLVVLDINMPGMSGLDVLKSLRSDAHNSQLPVIMATARAQSENMVEALELGANDYVTKPIDFPVLKARVLATLRVAAAAKASGNGALPSPPTEIGIGTVLAERYELLDSIGRGGFGEVFRAEHRELARPVAVKVLRVPNLDDKSLARFRREGVNACRVQHPNAVSILDSGVTDGGVAYLVMELLEGNSLQQEMRDWKMSPRHILEMVAPVCDALAAAHKIGIVHRDIKPANIFLHGTVPKVLDFGLAKLVGSIVIEQRITLDGWMVGTPLYMAPERFGSENYDGRSDVYSVGVMLHQLLTGKMPFAEHTDDPLVVAMMHTNHAPKPLREHDESQSAELEALLLRTLRKDPGTRPSATDLAAELVEIARGLPATAPKTPRQATSESTGNLPTIAIDADAVDQGLPARAATVDLAGTLVAKRIDPTEEE